MYSNSKRPHNRECKYILHSSSHTSCFQHVVVSTFSAQDERIVCVLNSCRTNRKSRAYHDAVTAAAAKVIRHGPSPASPFRRIYMMASSFRKQPHSKQHTRNTIWTTYYCTLYSVYISMHLYDAFILYPSNITLSLSLLLQFSPISMRSRKGRRLALYFANVNCHPGNMLHAQRVHERAAEVRSSHAPWRRR